MKIYEIAAPEVLAEDFGGEIVAIDLESGRYFSLRGLAHALWSDLQSGHSQEAIEAALKAIDPELARAASAFIDRLKTENLIRERDSATAASGPLISAVAATAGSEPPMLEAFDDMADLIKADPIHEVDENLGWPVRKGQQSVAG